MKKSFVLYTDKFEAMKILSMEQRGVLLTAIYSYEIGEELPEMDDMTRMMFLIIRQNLDDTAEKYQAICEKRREAGAKGGRPRKANGFSEKQMVSEKTKGFSEKHTDNDNENDNENDTDTENENDNDVPKGTKAIKVAKPPKHTYGEYQHVLLTDQEREKLFKAYGEYTTSECIRFLDEYIEEKGYKSKSHYLAIQRWVVNAVKEKSEKKQTGSGNPFLDAYRAMGGEL